MRLRDILSLAAHNLRESPLRTALCALSVAVGSGALLLILSIGLYGRKQVDVGLQTLGISGLSVYTESGHAGTILSAALADEIEQDVDGIRTLMPIKAQSGTVRVGHTTEHAVLLGTDERLGEVMQLELLAGSLPNAWRRRGHSAECCRRLHRIWSMCRMRVSRRKPNARIKCSCSAFHRQILLRSALRLKST